MFDRGLLRSSPFHVTSAVLILASVGVACHSDLSNGTAPGDSLDSAFSDSAVFVAAEVRDMARRHGYNDRRRRNRARPELVELGPRH